MDEQQEHSLFVRQEYRFATAKNDLIKATNPKAREVEIRTQLSAAIAEAMAQKYLDVNEKPRVYTIEIEGIVSLSSFTGGPPSFDPNFPDYAHTSGRLVLVSASADYNTGITTIEVRG